MSKESRRKRRDGMKRQAVTDAERLTAMLGWLANGALAGSNPGNDWITGVADEMRHIWDRERVVLRADPDLVAALLDTPDDVELDTGWIGRMPFGTVAVALTTPIRLFDGARWCQYLGFVAVGTRYRAGRDPLARGAALPSKIGDLHLTATTTYYGPMHDRADGVRLLWLFGGEDGELDGGQTVSAILSGSEESPRTIRALRDSVTMMLAQQGAGEEADVLVRVGLALLLYLASVEPDIDWLPPESIRRPQQLHGAVVANLGWRVGSALRRHRAEPKPGGGETEGGRWRLPPHIRRAHWHRVRVATRDGDGRIVGDRLGVQGVDWEYQLRWFPPAAVNVDEGGVTPAVRDVADDGGTG